jgi:Trehalose and maltose hydrolases (possible phosphorylases)
VDLPPNIHASDEGIHAAVMGGIWQCCVNGFGGVRVVDGQLRIEPHLPANWKSLSFRLYWQNQPLRVVIAQSRFGI